ncbi:hypothetical protein GDO86_018022 [Hymenochirus boettgeri]|uniref:Uncharacterized protein n=1 Tax=Hymenochirus boettgeri TaxID=247094 RepID=A0A8T2IE60_9PIPI|nr:hypothetical protein GDO86_018022 [Hymenochirus boettgeri]
MYRNISTCKAFDVYELATNVTIAPPVLKLQVDQMARYQVCVLEMNGSGSQKQSLVTIHSNLGYFLHVTDVYSHQQRQPLSPL